MDVRTGLVAVLVGVLAIVSYLLVHPFLQYVLGAALLAFLLYPLHVRLVPSVGVRISAGILTATAIVVVVIPLVIFSLIILDTALSFVDGTDQSDVESMIESVRSVLVDDLGVPPEYVDEVEHLILEEFEDLLFTTLDSVLGEVVTLLNATIYMAFGIMLLIFLLYYFLADGDRFIRWIREVSPFEDSVQQELEDEVSVVTWAVIGSHLLVAVVEGILGGIGLYLVGVSNVAFWTVVMIVVSVLPVVGVWLVWGPAVVYLFVSGDLAGAAFLGLYGVAVLSVVDNYLRAIFVDKGSGLHPAVVLIGVVGGIYLLGIMGLFLGPILLAVFKATVTVFSRNWTEVTGDGSEPDAGGDGRSDADPPASASVSEAE